MYINVYILYILYYIIYIYNICIHIIYILNIYLYNINHIIYRKYYITSTIYRLIGLVGKVFVNGPGDMGPIPVRVIPKTLKMVLDTPFLNTQQYKVRIKGKVEKFREKSSTLPCTSL